MGGGFNHARGGKGGAGEKLLNAELNLGSSKGNSIDAVLDRFQNKYGGAKKEYGVAVDENGYVHEHMAGGKSSVQVSGGKGMTIIHNHPSGGNFSDSDLLVVASKKTKGLLQQVLIRQRNLHINLRKQVILKQKNLQRP